MNRRGFLSLLGLGTAGMVLDPERLLWRPGAKTFFLPSSGPFSLEPGLDDLVNPVTVDWIAQETLRLLKNNLQFAAKVNRTYDRPIVGNTITIKRPGRYLVSSD